MTVVQSKSTKNSVGTPTLEYDSMSKVWARSRAILNGEAEARAHDRILDNINYSNLLVPFSPRMSPEQYRWYVAESELPGLTAQYAKVLTGGLLRKEPAMEFGDAMPEEVEAWMKNKFTQDNQSMVSFLDSTIWEELSTSNGWISVDYPAIDNYNDLTPEEKDAVCPYPILWTAEEVINVQVGMAADNSRPVLTRIVFRYVGRDSESNEFHPDLVPTVAEHYLDDSGHYAVRYYQQKKISTLEVQSGKLSVTNLREGEYFSKETWDQIGEATPMMHGERMKFIPVFPVNGEIEYKNPLLMPLIDREVALYNKTSRRNHLLYGAATYTPVVFSDMSDEDFKAIVGRGLGSWLKLAPEDKVDVLKTPTDALADMDRAIAAGIEDMSKMGIRMLSPEGNQSGIALEIRNSSQTAQLGVLNTKISQTMTEVIKLMILWKYGKDIDVEEVTFTLSADFNPSPIGSEWLKLVTEWYESRLIPRSLFVEIAKNHDLIPPDYNDQEGREEIGQDTMIGAGTPMEIEEKEPEEENNVHSSDRRMRNT